MEPEKTIANSFEFKQKRAELSPLVMLASTLGALTPEAHRELSQDELEDIYREIKAAKDEDGNREVKSVDAGVELTFKDSKTAAEGERKTRWKVVILNTTETFSGGMASRRLSLKEDDKILIDYCSHPSDSRASALDYFRHLAPPLEGYSFDPLGSVSFARKVADKLLGGRTSSNGHPREDS